MEHEAYIRRRLLKSLSDFGSSKVRLVFGFPITPGDCDEDECRAIRSRWGCDARLENSVSRWSDEMSPYLVLETPPEVASDVDIGKWMKLVKGLAAAHDINCDLWGVERRADDGSALPRPEGGLNCRAESGSVEPVDE